MAVRRNSRPRQCLAKKQYKSRQEARYALWHVRQRGHRGLNYYHCPWCRRYHLGHVPRPAVIPERRAYGTV